MRHLLTLITLFLVSWSGFAQSAKVKTVKIDENYVINDFDFISESEGFAAGIEVVRKEGDNGYAYRGIVLRTTNGGKKWELLHQADSVRFVSVDFDVLGHGLVVGNTLKSSNPGVVLRSVDNGKSWDDVTPPAGRYSRGFVKVLKQEGGDSWILGNTLHRSTDDGVSWKRIDLTKECLPELYASYSDMRLDGDYVILSGGDGTFDYNTVFTKYPLEKPAACYSTIFPMQSFTMQRLCKAADKNFFILSNNRCWISTDDGENWEESFTIKRGQLKAIDFANAEVGIVGGLNVFQATLNGGKDWQKLPLPPATSINAIYFTSFEKAVVSGGKGKIFLVRF